VSLLDLSAMARSFTSIYQLLPTYRCIEGTAEPLHLRDVAQGVPNVDPARLAAAGAFHADIDTGVAASMAAASAGGVERYRIHPVVGIRQETKVSARVGPAGVELGTLLAGTEWEGDGTVPRLSATPDELRNDGREIFASARHASLQNAGDVLTQLDGILSGLELGAVVHSLRSSKDDPWIQGRDARYAVDLQVPDAVAVGEAVTVRARVRSSISGNTATDPEQIDLVAWITDLDAMSTTTVLLGVDADGVHRGEVRVASPSAYRVTVSGGANVSPASDVFLVYEPERAATAEKTKPAELPLRWSSVTRLFDGTQPFEGVRGEIARLAPQEAVVVRSGGNLYGFRVGEIARRTPLIPTGESLHDVLALREHEPSAVMATSDDRVPLFAPALDHDKPWQGRIVTLHGELPVAVGEPASSAADLRTAGALFGMDRRVAFRGDEVADEGINVVRYPSIAVRGTPAPSAAIIIDVDLASIVDEATVGTAVSFVTDESWRELAITARLIPPPQLEIDVDDRVRSILVRRNRKSIPCSFPCKVSDTTEVGTEVVVTMSFECEDRFSGSAQKTFTIVAAYTSASAALLPTALAAQQTADSHAATPPRVPGNAEVSVQTGIPAPTLTVEIFRPDPEKPGHLYWSVRLIADVPGLPLRLVGTSNLQNPADYVRGLANQGAPNRTGFLGYFENVVGKQIYQSAPSCFRDTYKALRAAFSTGFEIQFVSDDPYIPWELMWPDDIPGAQPLCVDHPVARWLLDYQTAMPGKLPAGEIVTIVPNNTYNGMPQLPKAQTESQLLVNHHGARALRPAERASFLDVLTHSPPSPTSILHFAGHGSFDGGPGASSIYLDDDRMYSSEIDVPKTCLAEAGRTLVIFNACEVAAGTQVLGVTAGWAKTFLSRRFGAFIAPLWPVYDDHASRILEEIVSGAVEEKRPIGRVLQEIRQRHFRESPTYLAYLYIGDVMARFT
jgi:hypothetical protein